MSRVFSAGSYAPFPKRWAYLARHHILDKSSSYSSSVRFFISKVLETSVLSVQVSSGSFQNLQVVSVDRPVRLIYQLGPQCPVTCSLAYDELQHINNWNHIQINNLTVPGDPQDIKVTPINSTSIRVNWKPPQVHERNGIILGYHVHVQEVKDELLCTDALCTMYFLRVHKENQGQSLLNEPMKFNVMGNSLLELDVTSLQPDTTYAVQVAALTRKGDGDRSPPVSIHTPGVSLIDLH
ncbi:hypothetical protein NQ317_008056 [Molorchus minor]|uniref:Fibronectin type-III domain-containing protein n=1 Tax=Molorchus minor TaxID=1323400 RepID=A0ABQ9IT55_9CUCU|nr:hypothetical protein NQ317_008056 [Molorchus minor]